MCDRKGAIYEGRGDLNAEKKEMAANPPRAEERRPGGCHPWRGCVYRRIGSRNAYRAMVKTMAKDAIIFACANPTPEIFPDEARAGGAAVIATGRSDYPNQVNNVLAFPGIFRGALDVRARDINGEMKIAAAHAIARLIPEEELSPDYIIPAAFDPRVRNAVAEAVSEAARKSGVARI